MSLDEREALARAATPGEWKRWACDVKIGPRLVVSVIGDQGDSSCEGVAAHIAASDPQTILRDIAELKAHRAFVAAFDEWQTAYKLGSYDRMIDALAEVERTVGEQA